MGDRDRRAFNWPGLVFLAVALVLLFGVLVRHPEATVAVAGPADLPPGPATEFGDGTYHVGTDIAPGSYRSAGPPPEGRCSWARLREASVVASAVTTGPAHLTTTGGEYLRVAGCYFVPA
jgi:hypothetical protein